MSNGAEKDYDFGPKRHWRRWLWNRIAERLHVPARDAVVLYLAGAEDHDREEALRRGFRAENLIAIERDDDVLSNLRERKVLAIEGNASDVVESWNPSRRVHLLLADFCGGVSKETLSTIDSAIYNPAFHEAVIAANFLRGRDAIDKLWDFMPELKEINHRGVLFCNAALKSIYMEMVHPNDSIGTAEKEALADTLIHLSRASQMSYKSITNEVTQVFDSVVFRNPFYAITNKKEFYPCYSYKPINAKAEKRVNRVRRRIAATLAHRTMRMGS